MGGLGPGIGGFELIIVAIVALIVVGPKDLPMLMRRVGQFMAKARSMAAEFRASFDEMARQSELDDLRKEVESLRSGQMMHRLGPEADAAFKDIRDDLNRPLAAAAAPGALEPTAPAPAEAVAPPAAKARKPSAARKTPNKQAAKPAARKSAARPPARRKPAASRKPTP